MNESEQSGPAGRSEEPVGADQPSDDETLPADHDGQPPAEEGGDSKPHDQAGSPEPHDDADSLEPHEEADAPELAGRSGEATGHTEVDSALERLAALDQDLPTSEHPPIFEATLRDLQRALADNPGAESGQPGEPAQP